jgi:hypothetical protein
MVPSIQVACLLAHCLLIGSLAELLFSFCMWSVLAFLQMVDAGTGKVISFMVNVLAFKFHCDIQLFHGLVPSITNPNMVDIKQNDSTEKMDLSVAN